DLLCRKPKLACPWCQEPAGAAISAMPSKTNGSPTGRSTNVNTNKTPQHSSARPSSLWPVTRSTRTTEGFDLGATRPRPARAVFRTSTGLAKWLDEKVVPIAFLRLICDLGRAGPLTIQSQPRNHACKGQVSARAGLTVSRTDSERPAIG